MYPKGILPPEQSYFENDYILYALNSSRSIYWVQ
jgi:hypothetical protein